MHEPKETKMNPEQSFRSSAPASSQPNGQTASNSDTKSETKDVRAKLGDAVSKIAEAAQQAGGDAKDVALSLASDANKKATGLLNQQFSAGADFAGHIAGAVKSAADSLDDKAPQLASFVRGAADTVEEFSRDIRGQTVQQLVKTASDYTRKQPALVFGLASLAGFALFRVLKSNTSSESVSVKSGNPYGAGQFHGT
jgi:ABC-type transporter Mla subunit MlaD